MNGGFPKTEADLRTFANMLQDFVQGWSGDAAYFVVVCRMPAEGHENPHLLPFTFSASKSSCLGCWARVVGGVMAETCHANASVLDDRPVPPAGQDDLALVSTAVSRMVLKSLRAGHGTKLERTMRDEIPE